MSVLVCVSGVTQLQALPGSEGQRTCTGPRLQSRCGSGIPEPQRQNVFAIVILSLWAEWCHLPFEFRWERSVWVELFRTFALGDREETGERHETLLRGRC